MNRLPAAAVLMCSLASAVAAADAPAVKVTRGGAQALVAGPASNFTGAVRVDAPFQATAPGRAGGATVTFEPGPRTAWHTHPSARP